ncbi:hypothetical protein EDD15DRAFT_2171184, partial [Pisolithus albus]
GITETFLGNYSRILMNDRVEGFSFNVLRDPTYVGGTPRFAATALWCVGIFIPWHFLLAVFRREYDAECATRLFDT